MGSDYYGTYCSNQNQIWCVNMAEYMGFGSIVGSDYYIWNLVIRTEYGVETQGNTWYMFFESIVGSDCYG